jgi:hypothetical protein
MRRKRRRRFRRSEPASRWWRTLQLQHRSSSPRMRGSSTPRLLVSITAVSGILGRRSSRTMTDEFVIQFRDLAAPCVRAFAINSRPLQSEGAGDAGRPMRPIAACAMGNGRTHTRCQVTPESPGIPHAMVYGLYVLSPAIRICLSPSSANYSADFTPTLRRQDHTISPSASGALVRSAIRVHRIPVPRW